MATGFRYELDVQFGGYKSAGTDAGDLGNSWKDYFKVFIPTHGDDSSPEGEQIAYQGILWAVNISG